MKHYEGQRVLNVDPYKIMGLIAVVMSGAVSSILFGLMIPAIGDGILALAVVLTSAI